jgi:hypothetical protein
MIYFSGHGVLDDNGGLFLAIKDTETRHLRATALPSAFITTEMDQCRSKRKILILDCCHSGAFERSGIKGNEETVAITESTFKGDGYGRFVITASNSTQFALEGNQILEQTEFSLFTHFLIDGLQTGKADTNNDGYISLAEWYDYAFDRIKAITSKQTPNMWAYGAQGEVIIAQNHKGKEILNHPSHRAPLASAMVKPTTYSDDIAYELASISHLSYDKFEEDDRTRNLLISKLKDNGFDLIALFSAEKGAACAILVSNDEYAVLAFRMTESEQHALQTIMLTKFTNTPEGKIHAGLKEAYDLIAQQIMQALPLVSGLPLYITGHSGGGALALIATQELERKGFRDQIAACYTFGSPKVGNEEFDRAINSPIYRIVNTTDSVTLMPLTFGYIHVGDVRFLGRNLGDLRRGIPFLRRAFLFIGAMFMGGVLLVKDHAITEYMRKLEAIIQKRNKRFGH